MAGLLCSGVLLVGVCSWVLGFLHQHFPFSCLDNADCAVAALGLLEERLGAFAFCVKHLLVPLSAHDSIHVCTFCPPVQGEACGLLWVEWLLSVGH